MNDESEDWLWSCRRGPHVTSESYPKPLSFFLIWRFPVNSSSVSVSWLRESEVQLPPPKNPGAGEAGAEPGGGGGGRGGVQSKGWCLGGGAV